jgi:NAD-dependent dihydropyrimidine dehydrogenase PreA subunit
MHIDPDQCSGCGQCIAYCPVNVIALKDSIAEIDLDGCVECSNCLRNAGCPTDAIYQQELVWPRTIRKVLSDVLATGVTTDLPGRGTEEMKTNDVTGRFKKGYAGIAAEFGRPILGTRIYDVEKVAQAVAALGVKFEKLNPTMSLMEDPKTGKFKKEVLNEKVMSLILEFTVELSKLPDVLKALEKASREIETVFSLDLITRVAPDGSFPTDSILKKMGLWIAPNGKTCVGLGRPLAKEV